MGQLGPEIYYLVSQGVSQLARIFKFVIIGPLALGWTQTHSLSLSLSLSPPQKVQPYNIAMCRTKVQMSLRNDVTNAPK
jgi:hypothetical protein